MVGIVIVSHSGKLAEGVVDATRIMADGCPVAAAGGSDDGGYGTSYEKISRAIRSVYSPDGVLILMDMGSAVMTTEMVLEELGDPMIQPVDCPLAEGAVAATLSALCGDSLEQVKQAALDTKNQAKW